MELLMNWAGLVRTEFARLGKQVDDGVVEELAQHAAAAFEAARADGQSAADAEARVRALVESWCAGTSGPRRLRPVPKIDMVVRGSAPLAGLMLDVRLALRLLRRQPAFTLLSITLIALAIASTTSLF